MTQDHKVIYSVSGDFDPVPKFGARIQQQVMPILSIADGQLVGHGTGFMIAPDGLMITAKHVIQDAWSKRVRKINKQGHFSDHCDSYALYVTNERHSDDEKMHFGGLLPIDKAWFKEELDIAYCWLRPLTQNGERIRFPACQLSPGIPKVDERIIGFGYYKMEGRELQQDTSGDLLAHYSQNTAHSAGRIIAVFPERRDSGMLNFPCFHTDARFDHGMSGGPVWNEKGYVCGVICSSTPQVEDDQRHISYISLLWPAMGTEIEVAIDDEKPEMRFVYELATKGLIKTDDTINNIRIITTPNNKLLVSIQY